MKPEKQERILNAAMKEFAQNGYGNASTDSMVKDASISKGALFYYFKNKKELFLYLYDFAIDILKSEILMKIDKNEKDIFVRIRQVALSKIEILKKHPEMYNFVGIAFIEESSDVKLDLEKRNKALIAGNMKILYEGIDASNFKEGIDTSKAFKIITWTMDGFTNANIEMIKVKGISFDKLNYDEMLNEMDIYLEILKNSFCK